MTKTVLLALDTSTEFCSVALLSADSADAASSAEPDAPASSPRVWTRHEATGAVSSTRLLLDSPAGRDPQMRALFSDLELILAQIVQLSGMPLQARERELIDGAMRDRDLLPRIRSAVPAGLTTS